MKKIALMTWHHVENYGTAYQAFALKFLIEKLGYSVELIDYRRRDDKIFEKRSFWKYINYIIRTNHKRNRRIYQFDTTVFNDFFDKYFTYTKRCVCSQDFFDISKDYDAFVCGSDQIWGPAWFDRHYFLDFVEDKRKKIAYAPSIGVNQIINKNIAEEIKRLLNQMAFLSVREKSGCEELKRISGRSDIYNVLDPVLLVDSCIWESISSCNIEVPDEEYMFVFFLKNNKKYFDIVNKEAREKKLKLLIMHSTQSRDNEFWNIDAPTPEELIYFIKHATYIATDSFHIMVLAIVFNVQFVVFNKFVKNNDQSQNGRLLDLLDKLDINDALYRGNIGYKINYTDVNKKINIFKEKSFDYLKKALLNGTRDFKEDENNNLLCTKNTEYCSGEYSDQYYEYVEKLNDKRKKIVQRHMDDWYFSLAEKCYECKFLSNNNKNPRKKKPIFYDELLNDLSGNKSVWYIYLKYYSLYSLPLVIKKFINKIRKKG